MANVTITRGTTLPDSSSKTDFHNLVDASTGSVTNIVNADIDSAAAIADSKLAQITTASKVHGSSLTGTLVTSKGADIASATTTDIGAATGNFVDITGTTTITGLGTIAAGAQRIIRFTGVLTFTHNATSLILPTGANITTANGDVASMVSLGSGNWKCVGYMRADGTSLVSATTSNIYDGAVVQMVNTITGAVATGTTAIPDDDTIPQITEGDEYMTLAITPKATTNKLKIEVCWIGYNTNNGLMGVCLFQDTTAGALACAVAYREATARPEPVNFTHYMDAGTTSATTFRVRAGGATGATTTFNGGFGSRIYGGKLASSITITEIKAS